AGSPGWEGTYIQTTATLTTIAASGTSNTNYDASEGGSSITFRIGNGLGILASQFAVGDRVTGRGAGGSFQTTFQINVGNLAAFGLAGAAGPDTTPPALTAVQANAGATSLTLAFSERLRSIEATLPSSYHVHAAADPSDSIAVTGAVMDGSGRSV